MPPSVPQPLGSNLPLASSLPKVSFRRIAEHEAQALLLPAGVGDQQNVNYGFNDGSMFEKPEHYMRFVEPIEADLKNQVEYDMDEQDKEWLDALNADRRKYQLDVVSYEAFEVIIDRLEKEWFDLMKRVPPKPQPAVIGPDGEPLAGNEDTQCAICDDGECENSNAIVFCDGCNLAVHQDCYGIPYIPEGQWLCRKCTVSPDRAVSCILCPSEGGAFKQTTQGKWAHLLCGLWIPETSVSNQVYMEPIDSVEKIPKARWKLQCYLCRSRHGACIQCDNKICFTAFHVTCARKAGLLIKAQRQRTIHDHDNSESEDEGEPLRAMCHKHLPKHLRLAAQGSIGKLPTDDEESSTRASTPLLTGKKSTSRKITIRRGANGSIEVVPAVSATTTKSARAYKKSYRAGPPFVPSYVIERVIAYVKKIALRKKDHLVVQVARFWSLKREARRGAPLLKRLHLEPWTAAASGNKEQTEADRIKRLQFMLLLREDLERLRMLAELTRKREQQKLRQMTLIRTSLIDGILFPFHNDLRATLEKIVALDRNGLFMNAVSRSEVPDYYDVVKCPMDWAKVLGKADAHQYTSLEEFSHDINLVCNNAILYNKADTSFHRIALKIKAAVEPLLSELKSVHRFHHVEAVGAGATCEGALAHAQELRLEPFYALLDNLQDYDQARRERTVEEGEDGVHAPANFVEDLIRQYHIVERPPPHVPSREEEARRHRREAAATQKEQHRLKMRVAAAEYRKRKKMEKEAVAQVARDAGAGSVKEVLTAASQMPESRRSSRSLHEADSLPTVRGDFSLQRSRSLKQIGEDGSAARSYLRGRRSDSGPSPVGNGRQSPAGLTVKKLNDHDTFTRFEAGWILPPGTHRARKSVGAEPGRRASSTVSSTIRGKTNGRRLRQPHSVASSSDLSDAEEQNIQTVSLKGKKRRATMAAEESSTAISPDLSPPSSRKRPRHSLPASRSHGLADQEVTPKQRATGKLVSSASISGLLKEKSDPKFTKSAAPASSRGTREEALQRRARGDFGEGAETVEVAAVSNASKIRGRHPKQGAGASGDFASPEQNRRKAVDEEADASMAVDITSTQKMRGRGKASSTPQVASTSPTSAFPPLTLVWAKVMSYPYYPAAVVDEGDDSVPVKVSKEGERQRAKPSSGKAKLYLVRFFDEQRSFGWVRENKLAMLFDEESVDEGFVQAAKAPRTRKEIEEAMEEARRSLDV